MNSPQKHREWLPFSELAVGGLVAIFVAMYWVAGEMAHGHMNLESGYVLLVGLLILTGVLVMWLVVVLFPEPGDPVPATGLATNPLSKNSNLTGPGLPVS